MSDKTTRTIFEPQKGKRPRVTAVKTKTVDDDLLQSQNPFTRISFTYSTGDGLPLGSDVLSAIRSIQISIVPKDPSTKEISENFSLPLIIPGQLTTPFHISAASGASEFYCSFYSLEMLIHFGIFFRAVEDRKLNVNIQYKNQALSGIPEFVDAYSNLPYIEE